MSKENVENTPPTYYLLPVCIEANTDVFLYILRSVVLKSRLHDNIHVQSMISGMTGESFQVDTTDLLNDWRNLTSDLSQIRQSKLLGFWAVRHYPLIGKKLIGAAWQPPEKSNVHVVNSAEMTDEDIDKIVSKKMKLRVIELCVGESVLKRLKCFVRAPLGIGRNNVTLLSSSKMRAFDIEGECLESCWKALESGGFRSNFKQQMFPAAKFITPQHSIVTSHSMTDQDQIARKSVVLDQSAVEKTNSSPTRSVNAMDTMTSRCNVMLVDISAKDDVASNSTIPTTKRARHISPSKTAVVYDETNFHSLGMAISEMRKDIQKLTKSVEPKPVESENESNNDSERFHLAVFKQKDDKISELRDSIKKLEEKNELLEIDKMKLNGDVVEKSNIIIALQKEVEVNSKLHSKMEQESNLMVEKLSDADKFNIAISETNDKLQGELASLKDRLAHFENFQREKHDLLQKLSAANQVNCDLAETIRKVREEETNFQHRMQDLVQKMSASDELNVKLNEINEKLERDLSAANNHFADMKSNLQCQLQELGNRLTAANGMNIELTGTNDKLQQELGVAKDHLANTESRFHCQLQDIVHKLSGADRTNMELADSNRKFQQELNAANNELLEKRKIGETINNLKIRSKELTEKFKTQVKEMEKMNSELSAEKVKLQEELNTFKQDAAKDKELINTLLSNRSATQIRTDRQQILNVYSEHDQELETVNIRTIGVAYDKGPESIDQGLNEDYCCEWQTDRDNYTLPSEPMKPDEEVTVEPNKVAVNTNQDSCWKEVFATENEIVTKCRPILQRQKFGWMKFQPFKNAKFSPAFVFGADSFDGVERAQKIKSDGFITNVKNEFFDFHFGYELPADKKLCKEKSKLKKFNINFGANFE